jgi:hypothetical protein
MFAIEPIHMSKVEEILTDIVYFVNGLLHLGPALSPKEAPYIRRHTYPVVGVSCQGTFLNKRLSMLDKNLGIFLV